jgi:hypothetical protein
VRDGVHGSSERTTQQHVVGNCDREIFLRERNREKQACWAGTHKPGKWHLDGRTSAWQHYRITIHACYHVSIQTTKGF